MKEWTFEATVERIPWLTDQVNEVLEGLEEGQTVYYTYYEANPFAGFDALPAEHT